MSNKNEMTTANTTAFMFKSEALNRHSAVIKTLCERDTENRVALAIELGEVLTSKCYTEDGFKSVGEYAEETFGIQSSNAYQLAKVGERFYNNKSEAARRIGAMFSPSKLAVIAAMDDETIEQAIEDGEINEDSTQADLKEARTRHASAKKSKVLSPVHVFGYRVDAVASVDVNGVFRFGHDHGYAIDEMGVEQEYLIDRGFTGDGCAKTSVTVKTPEGVSRKFNIAVDYEGSIMVYMTEKMEKPEKTPAKGKINKTALKALLETLSDEEREELLAGM